MNNTTQDLPEGFLQCLALSDGRWICKRYTVAVIYASIIPLIIGANLLLIIGIIKTKRDKFTSSQILFLTLFLSDLTVAVVQLPMLLYIGWKESSTCLEFQIGFFCICVSTMYVIYHFSCSIIRSIH